MNITPETKKLSTLFGLQSEESFKIPEYQRNYSWKEKQIETLDPKWKAARQNIERYLQQIANQNVGLEPILLSDRFFLYEDVAALLIDLIWQEFHNQLDIKETLYFYRHYKIQISDKYLLTAPQNS